MKAARNLSRSKRSPAVRAADSARVATAAETRSRSDSDSAVLNELVLVRAHVAQVAGHAHDLMIADERHDAAAGAFGLVLELAQQIQRAAAVRSAIDDVAGLHQHRGAAAPSLPPVDDLRRLKNLDEPFVGAVHVADRDDAIGRREAAGRALGAARGAAERDARPKRAIARHRGHCERRCE